MTAQQLKNSILQLAVQGKLVPQDKNDEPASVLLEKIKAEKEKLIKEKKIKKEKPLAPISDEEKPFDIPDSWEWCRLGSLLSVQGGKRVPKGAQLLDIPTNHIYIRVTDMKDGTIIDDKLKYIDDNIFQQIKKYIINKDDLYLTIAGTIGNVGVVPDKFDGMNLTENAVKLTNILINRLFIKCFINSNFVQIQFIDKTNTVAQPKLAIERILTTIIPLPPLAEQKRIVEKIEKLLPHIEEYGKAEQKLTKLNKEFPDQLKKSILQYAVEGKLVPQDKNDEPASVLLEKIMAEKEKLIKEKKIKKEKPFDIPDSWEWCRLGEVVQLNPRNKLDENLEVSFIPMTLISDGYSNSHASEKRKWQDVKSGFTHFAESDIGIAKITPCFQNKKSVVFKKLINGFGAGTTELHILRIYSETIFNEYLLWFCKTGFFIEGGVKAFTGTAGQQRVGKDYLNNLAFPLPPFAEQKRIVEKIEEIFKVYESLKKQRH